MAASSTTASQMASSRIAASNLYSWQNSLRRNWMPRQPLLFTYWLLRHPVFWFNSFFPTQSIRLPLVTYPSLCITYVTYRTLWDAIVYQELPNQPSPREAENFPMGEKNFKHVPLLKYLMYFSPKVLYMVGPICVLESPHRPFISISLLLSQLFKSSICL